MIFLIKHLPTTESMYKCERIEKSKHEEYILMIYLAEKQWGKNLKIHVQILPNGTLWWNTMKSTASVQSFFDINELKICLPISEEEYEKKKRKGKEVLLT